MIILMVSIWFVVTLPLPWMVTGDVGQGQLATLLPIIGLISIPFVALGVVLDFKARVNNLVSF